jgi:hypothetical protein
MWRPGVRLLECMLAALLDVSSVCVAGLWTRLLSGNLTIVAHSCSECLCMLPLYLQDLRTTPGALHCSTVSGVE